MEVIGYGSMADVCCRPAVQFGFLTLRSESNAGSGGGSGSESAQHAELIALGVGEDNPTPVGPLAQVGNHARAESDYSLDLLVPMAVGRAQAHVHPVLDRLGLRDLEEQQPSTIRALEPALIVSRLLVVIRIEHEVFKDLRPPHRLGIRVIGVDAEVAGTRTHDPSLDAWVGWGQRSEVAREALLLLAGNARDQLEVLVNVEDREAGNFSGGGDHEVRDPWRAVLASRHQEQLDFESAILHGWRQILRQEQRQWGSVQCLFPAFAVGCRETQFELPAAPSAAAIICDARDFTQNQQRC